MITEVATVLITAIVVSIGVLMLAGTSESVDCTSLPGVRAAGTQLLNQSYSVYSPAQCTRLVPQQTTVQVNQTQTVQQNRTTLVNQTQTIYVDQNQTKLVNQTRQVNQTQTAYQWVLEREQCFSAAGRANPDACTVQRDQVIRPWLDSMGYHNLKNPGRGCQPSEWVNASTGLVEATVPRSEPNSTNQQTLGYCYGRMWVGADLYYVTSWINYTQVTTITQVNVTVQVNQTTVVQVPMNVTVQVNQTTQVPVQIVVQVNRTVTVQVNQTYSCQVATTHYRLVNVSVGTAVTPGSWAATCIEAEERTRTSYELIGLIVVIGAAAVVIAITLRLSGGGGGRGDGG